MAMMVIDNEYEIGDIVYLKTDTEQNQRLVFSFIVYKNDIIYRLAFGTINSDHYGFELSPTKNILVDA
jgi:hypothetical protein